MKTLVLGIGNPILSDDGAGVLACRMLKEMISESSGFDNVDIYEENVSGLGLLDVILGYDAVILIDSIKTKKGKVGEVYKLGVDDFVNTLHLSSRMMLTLQQQSRLEEKTYQKRCQKILPFMQLKLRQWICLAKS
ncbi:MAG: hydrogenase maturation protease [Halobacteriota archaeon]|nr:hydrogenase maturation protease [Halobacteriota archaeon]